MTVSESRYVPNGRNTVSCASIADCRAAVSSVLPSPFAPESRTLTAPAKAGRERSGIAIALSGGAKPNLLSRLCRMPKTWSPVIAVIFAGGLK